MTVTVKGRTTVKGKTSTGFTPALDLDFTTALASGLNPLDKRIQFDRVQTTADGSKVTGSDGYIRNSPHNSLNYSDQFDNSYWTKEQATISSNVTATTDPLGGNTADKLIEDSTNNKHDFYNSTGPTIGSGTNITYSIYAKAAERSVIQITFFTGSVSGNPRANYDLANGVLGSVDAGITATITSVGNGWYRCSATAASSGLNVNFGAVVQLETSTTAARFASYLGNGTSGVYVWGAQLESNLTPSYYVPTTSAAVYNTPRFDYDPVTLAAKGLLVEETRTNLCLQSNTLTSASWTKSNITTSQTATGPDGVTNSATILTASANNGTALQAITSASAERITSTYIRRNTGTGNIDLTQDNGSTWTTVTVTSSWTRVNLASVTSANPTIGIRIQINGDAVEIWGFQHEIGAFTTSAIPTTSATVTRNADIAVIGQSDFTSFWTPTTTNKVNYSEQFNNSYWAKTNQTVTANNTTAPDGNLTADKIIPSLSSAGHAIGTTGLPIPTDNNIYCNSVFAKNAGYNWAGLSDNATGQAVFNLTTGALVSKDASILTATSQDYGNGWWRLIITFQATSNRGLGVDTWANSTRTTYAGDGTSGIFLWGAQSELGSTATDYVVTIASSTAAAPVTLYTEFDSPASGNRSILGIDDGTANNQIRMRTEGTAAYTRVAVSNVEQAALNAGTVAANTFYKFDAGVNANQFGTSLAGAAAVTATSGTYPTAVNLMRIGTDQSGAYLNGHVRRLRLWKNRLYDSILQSLTS